MPDPTLDLVFERTIDIPPAVVWTCWTTPEHLKPWFTPAPWQTTACEIDLRPGGTFFTLMKSPDGQEFPNAGCYLEIVPPSRLVWTNAVRPDYRPSAETGGFLFTAVLTFEPHGGGTRYTATVLHRDAAGRQQHEQMGFHDGWGKALDQLVAYAKTL